jgi:hypothetical protein
MGNNPEDVTIGDHAGKRVAWLAGFIDADGSIGLHRQAQGGHVRYVPAISMVTSCQKTSQHLMALLKEIGIGHNVTRRVPPNKNWSAVWVIDVRGMKRTLKLLPIVSDYLVTKKEEADIVSQFISYRKSVSVKTPHGQIEDGFRSRLRAIKENRNATQAPETTRGTSATEAAKI